MSIKALRADLNRAVTVWFVKVRLPPPIRGLIYGLAAVVAVPVAWQDGKHWQAVAIGAIVLLGILLEARVELRRRIKPHD